MKIAGIIAEYNPFHNGHLHQIEKTKEQGATHIVAVMSGGFAQRGEIAIFSKWARAKAALLNGVDLVVELPVCYAVSSANRFAKGGVFILNELCADMISFGSECGDLELLKQTGQLAISAEASTKMSELLKEGMSYPRAREAALNSLFGNGHGEVLANPNNLLGIEYIKAVGEINPQIECFTIMREQVLHDSMSAEIGFASASYLRNLLESGDYDALKQFIPSSALEVFMSEIANEAAPILEGRIEAVMLFKLRTMSKSELALLPDVSEGLENRLYSAARSASSISEFYSLVKTKRYTLARLRRIVHCALIGITAADINIMPQYVNILAMNSKGMEILAKANQTAKIPIMSKFADLYKKSPTGIDIDVTATDIAALAAPKIQPASRDFTQRVIIG